MAIEDPERIEISNLETGEGLRAIYNPEKVEATLEVNFTKLVVPGLSHTILQFVNTGNLGVTFELGFDSLSFGSDIGAVEDMRNFMWSLCYPSKDATSVATGSTPRVLLYWPRLYTLICKVGSMKETHNHFDISMGAALFTMAVTLMEDPQSRIFSEDVRERGTVRGA